MHFKINSKKYEYTSEYVFLNSNEFNVPLIEFCNIKGYKIPHYCYHNKLSIAGNCRMCLIELKNSPKPIVSCAMTTKTCLSNSELFTNSPLVKKARENITLTDKERFIYEEQEKRDKEQEWQRVNRLKENDIRLNEHFNSTNQRVIEFLK